MDPVKQNAMKKEECCVCRRTSAFYFLPCHHPHCEKCLQIMEEKTIQCGVCHFGYAISQGSQEASSVDGRLNTSRLRIIVQNKACSKTEIWCCNCGKQIANCCHGGARGRLTDCSTGEDGSQSTASMDKDDEGDVYISAVSSLDFNSLLKSSDMAVTSSDFYTSTNLDKCSEHGYALANYCSFHETPCCPECTTLHHKVCNTLDIHEAAASIPSESQVNSLKYSLSAFTDIHQGLIHEMESNNTEIDAVKEKIRSTFKELKAVVQNKLEKLEDDVKVQIQETESEQNQLQAGINDVKERCKSLQNARTQLESVTSRSAENLQLFCHVKAKLEEQKKFIHTQRQRMSKLSISITEQQTISDHLEQIPKLIQTKLEKIKPETLKKMKCEEKLEVRRWTHTNLAHITGMCYLESELVICDTSKKRLFTLDNLQAWYCVRLQHFPWDVTTIEEKKIAVSTTSGIQIVDLKFLPNKELGFPSFLPTAFPCFGVNFFSGNLYIASNTHIHKMSLDGNLVQSIKCKGFSVQYLCVKNADCIYYSDTNSNSVFCVNSKGAILKVFTSDYMEAPRGLAIGPSTNIMVVNALSYTVLRFTMDGQLVESSELKSKDKKIPGPEAICTHKDSCAIAAKQFIYRCLFV